MIGTMKKGKTVGKTYEEVIQRRDGDVWRQKTGWHTSRFGLSPHPKLWRIYVPNALLFTSSPNLHPKVVEISHERFARPSTRSQAEILDPYMWMLTSISKTCYSGAHYMLLESLVLRNVQNDSTHPWVNRDISSRGWGVYISKPAFTEHCLRLGAYRRASTPAITSTSSPRGDIWRMSETVGVLSWVASQFLIDVPRWN